MKGSMRQVGAGVWELMVYLPKDPVTGERRRQWQRFKGTKRQAQMALSKLVTESQDARKRATSVSVETIMRKWLEARQGSLAPKTALIYRQRVEQVVRHIGAVQADELTAGHVDAFYRLLEQEGVTQSVRRQVHEVFRAALQQAVRWEWLDRNPVLAVKPPVKATKEIAVPTVEQLRVLLDEGGRRHEYWRSLISIAAITGLRRGELCGLRFSDYDGRVLTVRRNVTYTPATGIHIGETTTKRVRRVWLDDAGCGLIEGRMHFVREKAVQGGFELAADPYLFSFEPDAGVPAFPDAISRHFRTIADKHGWRELHFHSLRHFTATQLIAAGVDVRTVSGRLGHSTPTVTLNVYSHVIDEREREAAAIMSKIVTPSELAARAVLGTEELS